MDDGLCLSLPHVHQDEVDVSRWHNYTTMIKCISDFANERTRIKKIIRMQVQVKLQAKHDKHRKIVQHATDVYRELDTQRSRLVLNINARLSTDISNDAMLVRRIMDIVNSYTYIRLNQPEVRCEYQLCKAVNEHIEHHLVNTTKRVNLLLFMSEALDDLIKYVRLLMQQREVMTRPRRSTRYYVRKYEDREARCVTPIYFDLKTRYDEYLRQYTHDSECLCPMFSHEPSFAIDLYYNGVDDDEDATSSSSSLMMKKTSTSCVLCAFLTSLFQTLL